MPTIQYPKNPNIDTAFVVQDDGTKNRALMTAPQDTSTLELPSNSNSTKGYVTVDGKKQRVILTADIGGGGGGGGSVDYAKTVQRAETMPTAAASNAGQQFLYSGESDATYTHGYIYENVKTATYTGTVSFEAATLSGTTVTCSGDDFANFLTEAGADPTPIVSGTMTFEADANGWRLVGKDSNDNTVTTFIEYVEDYEDAGFVFTGTPQDNDVIAFTCTVEEASATYTWTRIDVQPSPVIPDPLPSQTGNAGKFLTTDGTDASWSDKPLVNRATGTQAVAVVGTATGTGATSVGLGVGASGSFSLAAGWSASSSASYSVALGARAKATAIGAIQLNSTTADTTNSDANTFKVANANGNFEIMSADGTIPEARLADTTSAQQGDVLTLDSNGNAVWQAGASGTSSITVTLAAASWSGSSQTVTATGVTASNTVLIGAAPASASEYNTCGVLCTAQGADSLTFTCTSTPTNDLTVNVIIL